MTLQSPRSLLIEHARGLVDELPKERRAWIARQDTHD